MELKEFSGQTAEEATAKAEAHFGLSRDDLMIKVVADEAIGLLGFGMNKRAVIVARPKAEAAGRARSGFEQAAPADAPRGSGSPAGRGRERDRPRARPEQRRGGRSQAPTRRVEAPVDSAVPGGPETERSAHAREILTGVLSRMHVDSEVEIADWETEEAIELRLQTDAQGLLTGPGGEVLEAITYLVNRMANKGATSAKRIIIQAGEFRSDRVASLEKLALKMAARVRASGEAVTLDPMNSYDRRIVHITLEKETGVSTESVGSGALKSLVIHPAN